MILLDTCTLLWLASDPEKLSEEAKKMILKHADGLFVSAISAFEIGVKANMKIFALPSSPAKWFRDALEFHGISEIPISSDIAILSTQLPPLHRDPCDRILIATSKIHDLVLLTPDKLISQYPGVKVGW